MTRYQKQQGYKVIGTIGDVNPIEHDGGQVIDMGDGRFQLEYVQKQNENDDDHTRYVYQIDLDPVDPFKEWGQDTVSGVCSCCGIEQEELVRLFASEDPMERVRGYEAFAGYWGWHEFDPNPITYQGKGWGGLRGLKVRFKS